MGRASCPGARPVLLPGAFCLGLVPILLIMSVNSLSIQEMYVRSGDEFIAALRQAPTLPLHIRLAPGSRIDVVANRSMLPSVWGNGTLKISSSQHNPAVLSLGWRSEVTVSA